MDAERLEQSIVDLLAESTIARMKKYGMGDKLEPTAERTIASAAALIIRAHQHDAEFIEKLQYMLEQE
jgi:hypothetical protein